MAQFKKGQKPWNFGKGIWDNCKVCDKKIWLENNQIGRKKFCSKKCCYEGRELKGTFQKGHEYVGGGRKKGSNKYRRNVENFLLKKLNTKNVVHHIDENKKNNQLINLFIFKHTSAHSRWHHFLRRHSLKGLLVSNLAFYE